MHTSRLTLSFAICALTTLPVSAADDPRDLGGVWQAFASVPADAKPELSADGKVLLADFYARYPNPVDPPAYCLPLGVPGMMTHLPGEPFEIVQAFSRLTLLAQDGAVRRVRIGDESFDDAAAPTHMGVSIAHWENDTLVVETRQLTDFRAGTWPRSTAMTVTERMTKTRRSRVTLPPLDPALDVSADAAVLEVQLTIADPTLYREAQSVTMYYRELGTDLPLTYSCEMELWQDALESANP